ncbi:DUF72 domain-containing protein [Mammaliicoccus sciuri]|uniref:DUF72 domain-containing protein n=1 Tax=Mammaliicoccus sciuri TaxID=1296 RepID=UPI0007345188|nr:DUF72 domain-containing protein [Mammaliicoccus sciuri]KTT79371.1 hypothetical protein NS202_13045 [Mammaliicoccus sciuri]MBA1395514.1 DUF72 domain-containing protein [Mammaliicoccus sciuri]MBO1209121.1 DUF72 domain-containing protein [Mammaliicoccus sciuri]MCC2088436.1 DUF72 domain-containing protein [Mammaliicoccus sciuri]MCD5141099.1 DUF72 domain-containing protein [Mammaliicoccus sciuri]
MIKIGLTGWGDHDSLYEDLSNKKDKLKAYAAHFPLVELDATYYAIQPQRNIEKWIRETPNNFKFVVKIHQALTGHAEVTDFAEDKLTLFNLFKDSMAPLKASGKLAMILVQFPPWFNLQPQNINYLRYVREQLKDFDVCIEFRNRTWFKEGVKEYTLEFLTEMKFIHSVCDEPQCGEGSIPLINRITHDVAFVRYHGRNVNGWTKKDMTDQEWRDVRYLYDYNEAELKELADKVKILEHKAKDVYVVFNNNSGGHAAQNAKTYQKLLDIEYEGLAPKQLKLF